MKLIEQFDSRWNKLVEKSYEQNENFDYKQVKNLSKEMLLFSDDLLRKKKETETTLKLVEFNSNQSLKADFEHFVEYADEMLVFLENIVELKPNSKKGYYNYLKNLIGFL